MRHVLRFALVLLRYVEKQMDERAQKTGLQTGRYNLDRGIAYVEAAVRDLESREDI